MRFATRIITLVLTLLFLQSASAQTNVIKYNNQQLFLSGANLAWSSFANDIGPATTDTNHFADVFLAMHEHGGNALRWWLHTDGTVTPDFDGLGFVTGPGVGSLQDMKAVLDLAWEREIGVKLCLWSFNMLASSNNPVILNRNRLLLTDTAYTNVYIRNSLIPMVESLKGHPAIITWEIFNEPEGMSNEFGWGDVQHVPMAVIQRFINLCAGAIHRTDTTAQVTNGAWSFKALTDTPVAKPGISSEAAGLSLAEQREAADQLRQKYRSSLTTDEIMLHLEKVANLANFNYYSDSRLIAAGGDPDGTLDFYSVHYYVGIDATNPTSISPFHHPAIVWGAGKPIVVAEFAVQNTLGILKQALYDTLYQLGYAGALAWSWTDANFSSQADMLAGMQFMWDHHRAAVDLLGSGGHWPTVAITAPTNNSIFADSAEVTITASAVDSLGSITLVEFYASDTLKIGEANTSPFTVVWKHIPSNTYALTAVATNDQSHKRTSARVNITVGTPPMKKLEAEAATRTGPNTSIKSDNAASNHAYVDFAGNDTTTKITWQVQNVSAAGTYPITFGYRLFYASPKSQYINVNGMRVATLEFTGVTTTAWYEKTLNVDLILGTNTVQMQMFWGWMYCDYLAVPTSLSVASVDNGAGAPVSYSLSQNYPNPFNPSTTFQFTLVDRQLSIVKVYDILGQEVATLLNEVKPPGIYTVQFDAKGLASGVYFYRLQAGDFVATRKLVLVK